MASDLKKFPKGGMGQNCIICKTPANEWAWVKRNHPPPQEEAWHWLIKQKV